MDSLDGEDCDEMLCEDAGAGQSEEANRFDLIVGKLEELIMDPTFESIQSEFCRKHCTEPRPPARPCATCPSPLMDFWARCLHPPPTPTTGHEFEEDDENKLVYTQLFSEYQGMLEGILEQTLTAGVPGFDMMAFMQQLEGYPPDMLVGDVFDVLYSLTDFASFKVRPSFVHPARLCPGPPASHGSSRARRSISSRLCGASQELMLDHKRAAEGGCMPGHLGDPALGIHVAPMHARREEQEDGEERPDLNLSISSLNSSLTK